MSITFDQYLQSLLQSITTYYTATYSNDTELYNILQMYGIEFASGSTTIETVRNNLFITVCENSKLYDNFGTYFNQNKYIDQTYVEDRYISGSSTYQFTTPALQLTDTVESLDDWTFISHDSPDTNFPYSFDLGNDGWGPPNTIGQPLGQTAVIGGKLYTTCVARIPITPGDPISPAFPLVRIVYYDIATNTWGQIPTVCNDTLGTDSWKWRTYDDSGNIPIMGLIVDSIYLGNNGYDTARLYSFDFLPTDYISGPGTPHWDHSELVGVKYNNLDTVPEYTRTDGFLRIDDTVSNITYTDSMNFHDKIYMALATKSHDGPDTSHRWPFLVHYDPVDNIGNKTGFAAYMQSTVGNANFVLHAMAKYDNKLWVDVTQDIADFPFTESSNSATINTIDVINDFETSGSTIFAATGLHARLLYSTNDGNTWAEKVDLTYMTPSPSHLYCCKEFDAQDGSGSFLYVGTSVKAIFRAPVPHTSGSWEQAALLTPSYINDLETFNGALFAACGASTQYIYKTTNGTNWTEVSGVSLNKGSSALKRFGGYLYAAGIGNNNVIRSFNDGTVWENAVDGLGTAGTNVAYLLETHKTYLYSTNHLHQLVRTSNGTTWDIVYEFGTDGSRQINSILSYQNTLYIGLVNGELWSSVDDGETFTLFQIPTPGAVSKLDKHNGYAFCGATDTPDSKIFKWGGGSQHYMTTYDGINFEAALTPADIGDTVLKMHSYNNQLYAIINSVGGYTVRKYCDVSRNLTALNETKGLWRFNQSLSDESGNNNDLTGTSVIYYPGYTESGLTAIRQQVTIPAVDATDFDFGTNSFTIEGWFKLGEQTEVLLQKNIPSHVGPGYRLIHFRGAGGTQDYIRCELTDSDAFAVDVDTITGSVIPNKWIYIAVVVDRIAGTARIYLDGKAAVNASENISSWTGNIGDATRDFIINGYNTAYFDEVCITAKALTAVEINSRAGKLWEIHKSFEHPINTIYDHEGTLLISIDNGDIFYLDIESDAWVQYINISDLSFSTTGVQAFASCALSPIKLYSLVDNSWYSSEFISSDTLHYVVPGAKISGSTIQYSTIPGYRKQLDFMLDAAMHGSTHQGIISVANAFTLINPDIREFYTTPQWKLKSTSGPITQLGPNTWQFTNSLSWRDNLWQGAHATFTSGSSVGNKIAAGYIILVNDNNTVDVGPIYDTQLLLDLTREV